MSERNKQCPHCGYFYSDSGGFYYSEDFARYMNRRKKFILQWCYNCNYVAVIKPAKLLGIIPLPSLSVSGEFPLDRASENDICMIEDGEVGGMAIYHLLLAVWWAFICRAELSYSEEEAPKEALRHMVEKIPLKEAGLCLIAASNAHTLLPLEVQIERGKYIGEHRLPEVVRDEMLQELAAMKTPKAQEIVDLLERQWAETRN